jgi:hypothetical protein
MAQIGALGPLPGLAVQQNPPVLRDITNIAMHRLRAGKRKLEDASCVTDNEFANMIILEHEVSFLSIRYIYYS